MIFNWSSVITWQNFFLVLISVKVQEFYDADASLILYFSWQFAFKMDTKIIISQLEKHIIFLLRTWISLW